MFPNFPSTRSRTSTTRFPSCGHCKRSQKTYVSFPLGARVCTKTPMRWVRSLCKLQVDFHSLCSAGTCVFFWSIPSMMIVTYFSGWFRDFSRWSWYFALSSLLMQNLQFNLCFRLRKTFNLILD